MSGGSGCLLVWFLNRKSGLVGRKASSLVSLRPERVIAANSLTRFPDAKAVKNNVLRNKSEDEAVFVSNRGDESISKMGSMDHWGIFCF